MLQQLLTRGRTPRPRKRQDPACPSRAFLPALERLEDRCLLTGDMVLRWNSILLGALRASTLSPIAMSRAAAMVQASVYEAVNAIDQTHTAYLVDIPAPAWASQEAATAQAAHDALVGLFPTQKLVLDLQLKASLQEISNGDAKTWGIAVGHAAAQILLAVRAHDGSDRVVTYTPGTKPGDWQPTPPAFAAPLAPQWPTVTPFALTSGAQFRPPPPPALTSADYTAAFNMIKDVGAFDSTTRTADQTEAALFWAGLVTPNSTAVGQWNLIAQEVALAKGNTLAQNARLFALLNLAEVDATISCWDAKYTYNLWRPVTAIAAASTDGNPNTNPDANWAPLLATPPHPSYPSGHSTLSTSSAQVLASFFGSDAIPFSLSYEGLPGVTRTFTSFSGAAHEAGLSRIWLGIHWSFDISAGETQGRSVGQYVFQNYLLARPRPGAIHSSAWGDIVVLQVMNSGPAGETGIGRGGSVVFDPQATGADPSVGQREVNAGTASAAGNSMMFDLQSVGTGRTEQLLTYRDASLSSTIDSAGFADALDGLGTWFC